MQLAHLYEFRDRVDKAFDYAKRIGVKLIVGIPEH